MNKKCYIKKLNKDEYIDLSTGEKKQFKHTTSRKDSYISLRKTFKKLRYLINYNFAGKPNELFLTLTYEENMQDTKRAYTDFNRFMMRLKRKYKDYSTIDYISVLEPQDRGAWHFHVLLRFNELQSVFILKDVLAEMWGQGIVDIQSLAGVDNIGAYLSAYVTDVEATQENVQAVYDAGARQIEVVEKQGKKFIKGGRLWRYPPGTRIYRKSKGIKYPDRKTMLYKHVKSIVGSFQPDFSAAILVEDENLDNVISYEYYNLKRKS